MRFSRVWRLAAARRYGDHAGFGAGGNHAGILLADGLLLHHMYGMLSQRVPYGGYWKERTVKVLRHKALM